MRFGSLTLSLLVLQGGLSMIAAQTSHVFRPSDADPAITAFDNRHYAYVDETVSVTKNKLVVFLPGTGGTPFFYREFLQYASTLGYHGLGLMYPNDKAVGTLCAIQDRLNPDCPHDVRLEILEGTDQTSLVQVDRSNSIENRLAKALAYLSDLHSTEGWDRYLHQDGSIAWDQIVICGHSQGGGHAAFVAKRHLVARCLVFAAADWFPFEDRPANWASDASVTPIHKVYMLGHLRDPLVPWDRLLLPFARAGNLDRFGEPVSVDASLSNPREITSIPYRHILSTDIDADNFHNAVIVDPHTPRDAVSGEPLFQVVWNYMLLSETPALSFQRQGTNSVEIYWHSGALQESSNLVDWGDTVGAQSPLQISLEDVDNRVFYRVRPSLPDETIGDFRSGY